MVRAEVLQGVRQMRFEGLLERHDRGELSQEETAEMLGIGERTFRPHGLDPWGAAAEEIVRMLGLYQERYAGFTVKHFHEQLVKRHHYKLGYTATRRPGWRCRGRGWCGRRRGARRTGRSGRGGRRRA